MSFLTNSSKKLEYFIFNEVIKRPNSDCLAIVFLDKDTNPVIYKLIRNKYKKAYLKTMLWEEEKWLYDLTWEEKKKIKDNLVFIDPKKVDIWFMKKRRSVFLYLFSKIHQKIIKV